MLNQHEFWKLLSTASYQGDFEAVARLSGTRTQKQRLQFRHKQSQIICSLQFGLDFELAESSQLIRDCIEFMPICKFIIQIVKTS